MDSCNQDVAASVCLWLSVVSRLGLRAQCGIKRFVIRVFLPAPCDLCSSGYWKGTNVNYTKSLQRASVPTLDFFYNLVEQGLSGNARDTAPPLASCFVSL